MVRQDRSCDHTKCRNFILREKMCDCQEVVFHDHSHKQQVVSLSVGTTRTSTLPVFTVAAVSVDVFPKHNCDDITKVWLTHLE